MENAKTTASVGAGIRSSTEIKNLLDFWGKSLQREVISV
jgi:hypothetical protein